MNTHHRLGVAAAATVMMIWSGWLVISRWGVTQALTNADILLLRFGSATLIVLPLFVWFGWRTAIKKFRPWTILAGLACGIPYVWLSFIGLEVSPTASAGVIVNGSLPVFTLILLLAMRQAHPTRFQFAGIGLIVIANVALVMEDLGISLFTYGTLLAAGFSLAIYTTVVKLAKIEAADIILVGPIVNFAVIAAVWLNLETALTVAPVTEIALQALYQGVLVSVAALWLMSYSLKHISPYTFSLIMAMVPTIAAVLAFLLLGESLTMFVLSASVLCTIGIIVFNGAAVFRTFLAKRLSAEGAS